MAVCQDYRRSSSSVLLHNQPGLSGAGNLKNSPHIVAMTNLAYPNYPTQNGVMTENIRSKYIEVAVKNRILPKNSIHIESIMSLEASNDPTKPIQFLQLYSVVGPELKNKIVSEFYERVYKDEKWFKSVFSRIASKRYHATVQSAMWIDVMGGGAQYRGGEFRLNFHHTHNAMELMNDKGAMRWVSLMNETLEDPAMDYTADARVRPAINTFLTYFMGKYAQDFKFKNEFVFGETNARYPEHINFSDRMPDALEALEHDPINELCASGVATGRFEDKNNLNNSVTGL